MRLIRHLLLTAVLALAALVVVVTPAAAHTGFDASDPADGATVEGLVEVVTLVFTGPAEPTGRGFEALGPSGEIRTPVATSSDDGTTWVLRFDPPLGAGTIGVRWMVKAPDAHPIDGSFSFTITPATTPTTTSSGAAGEATSPGGGTDPGASTTTEPAIGAASSTIPAAAADGTKLDAFLEGDSEPLIRPDWVSATARLVTLVGTLVGVGALIFAAAVLRRDRRDIRHVLLWVRQAGLIAVIGASIELMAQTAVEAGGDWSAVSSAVLRNVAVSPFGMAVALRLAGGVALALGAARLIASAAGDLRWSPVGARSELVGVGAAQRHLPPVTGRLPPVTGRYPPPLDAAARHEQRHRGMVWRPTPSVIAGTGAVALLAAHLFDGHTVVEGHRFWTGCADLIHVLAGAVWVGGVVMLARVLRYRRRHGREPQALHLALRFSVVATIALVIVGVAGLALAVIILDSPAELWLTEWGRTLLAKTGLVAVAAAAGAYNHRVLLPQLGRWPNDQVLIGRFRSVVTFEAVILAAVLAATALLMGAAS